MHPLRARWTHGPTAVARASAILPFLVLLCVAAVRADTTLDGLSAPIVRINMRQGNVTVRTWNRESVQVQADPAVHVLRRAAGQSVASYALPIPDVMQQSAKGPLELPAENFVITTPPGRREMIVVRDLDGPDVASPSPVIVTVPQDTVFLFARTGAGTLDVRDYHDGTFVGFVGRGRMVLTNLGGTAFAQTLHGPTIVNDSTFERFRARSLSGNLTFQRCNVRQIEASSVEGSIVYDEGSFEPGLARFESAYGDVAIGITSPAVLGGHAAPAGHVYTNFQRPARVEERDGGIDAILGGGGPLVTAVAERGSVFFYSGSLRARAQLPQPWQGPLVTLQRPGAGAAPRRVPEMPAARTLRRQRFSDYSQFGLHRQYRFRL